MICPVRVGEIDDDVLRCPACGAEWTLIGTDRLLPRHTRRDRDDDD